MYDPMTRIDYDQIRERAHRLRREAIAGLLSRAAAKLRTLMRPKAPPAISRSSCGA